MDNTSRGADALLDEDVPGPIYSLGPAALELGLEPDELVHLVQAGAVAWSDLGSGVDTSGMAYTEHVMRWTPELMARAKEQLADYPRGTWAKDPDEDG